MRDGNKLYVWAIAVLPAEGTSAISHEVDEAEVIIIFASKKAAVAKLWPDAAANYRSIQLVNVMKRETLVNSCWLQPF